jgi:uncharacterized protein YggT (Ycf19 family)
MTLLDSILNLAILLLWLSWRSSRLDPVVNSSPATLAGTLKTTSATHLRGWQFLIGLGLLLTLRVLVYREIGSPVEWTPKLNLGFVVLAFRSDLLATAALYSLLSTLRLVVVFYFWLFFLVAVNRSCPSPGAILRLIRSHLGRVARWPVVAQLGLPMLIAAGLWFVWFPALAHCRLVLPAGSFAQVAAQGGLVGLALILTLKYLIPPIVLLHMVNSYVYLGTNPLWDFIAGTSDGLLKPLRPLPLQIARLDLRPLAGGCLAILLFHWLPEWGMAKLAQRNLVLWPH